MAVFDPPEERTLRGIARFVLGCRLETMPPSAPLPGVPKMLVGGHMVRVGDESRVTMEFVVVRTAGGDFYAMYEDPPSDLRTVLPEMAVIDLLRSRGRLASLDGRSVMISALTVDEVNHLIVLAQGGRNFDDDDKAQPVDDFDAIEVVFDEDEE